MRILLKNKEQPKMGIIIIKNYPSQQTRDVDPMLF